MLRATLAMTAFLLLFAGTAAAQAPTSSIVVSAPAGPTSLLPGAEKTYEMSVVLKLNNIVCTGEASVQVSVGAEDKTEPMASVMMHLNRALLTFKVPQGAYQTTTPAGGAPYTSPAQKVEFMVMLSNSAPQKVNHTWDLYGKLEAGPIGSCQGSDAVPAATGIAKHYVEIMEVPKPPEPTNTTSPSPTISTSPGGGSSPSPSLVVGFLAVALVILARRRLDN